MPGGVFVGGLFFLLAFIAALTSSISILITVSAVGVEQFGLGRKLSATIAGTVVWAIGTAVIMISGLGSWVDFVSGSVLLPMGGLLVAIFVGWVAPRKIMRNELRNTNSTIFRAWHFLCRYLVPVAVGLILLLGIDSKFNFGLNRMIAGLAGG